MNRLLGCAAAIGLAACVDHGDGAFASSDTCGLNLAIGGGVEARLDHDVGVACVTQFSGGSGGVRGSLVPIDHPSGLMGVTVELPTLMRGMTGETTGDVDLRTEGDVWRASCSALVHEHRELGPAELGTRYRVYASLTCATAAVAEDVATAPITIGTLGFIYTISWQ